METWAEGRVALVTGATSGFGQAFARRLLAAGGYVIATGRRAERLSALTSSAKSNRLLVRQMDIRSADSVAEALKNLPPEFEAIDILFNNAGVALGLAKAQEASLPDWEAMIETNILGLVRVTRSVLPGMISRNRGDILNMSSVAANYPYPGGNVYGATKAFVRQFSLNLRADVLGSALRVTSIEPGMAQTEFSTVRFGGDEQSASKVYQGMQPLMAEDIATTLESILRLPNHININAVEIMPVSQAFAPFAVARAQS